MTDNLNIKLGEAPNQNYQKFFDKFKEIESLPVKEWTVTHLLGFFCKLYKNHYQVDYQWKFNSTAPSKCFEVFQMKKLGQNLSKDPALLKKYIEWAFKEKVKSAKRKITSIAFLSHEVLVGEYKQKFLAGELQDQKIDRTTLIAPEYLEIIKKYNYQISTYGELSFLIQIPENSILEMKQELEDFGLNLETLSKIS